MSKPVILLLGTCDTKLDELLYIRNEIVTTTKCDVLIFDVGRNTVQNPHIYKNLEKVLREHAPEVKHGELNRQTYNELATTHATEEVRRMYESIDASFNAAIAVGGSSGRPRSFLVAELWHGVLCEALYSHHMLVGAHKHAIPPLLHYRLLSTLLTSLN